MLVTPPIDLAEVVFLQTLHLSINPIFLRLLGILLLIVNSFLFSRLFQKKALPFLIFLINPWSVYLHTFFTIPSLAISLALIFMKKERKLLFLFLAVFSLVFFVKTVPKDYLFLSKLTPASLAFQINERQKIDFLATNKTFILPSIIRKIAYNKPFLAVDESIRHFISFFDFEQMVAPLESYEIIKLSGLAPHGNFPLFFLWEIPLIVSGIFLNRKFFPYFLISLIPIFAAEKKLFVETAYLTLPIFLFWETTALTAILNRLKPKLFLLICAFVIIFGVFPYYKDFYTKPLVYKNSESYFYEEIARWIAKNRDKNITVTTMFGPADKMVQYYLGEVPPTVSFSSFDLTKNPPKENVYYIGLPGQFTRRGKNLKETDARIPIIEKIKGNDELVFEYGEDLWIGYQK